MSLLITLMIPGTGLLALTQFTEEMSQEDALKVAAVAVQNYVDENRLAKAGARRKRILV